MYVCVCAYIYIYIYIYKKPKNIYEKYKIQVYTLKFYNFVMFVTIYEIS